MEHIQKYHQEMKQFISDTIATLSNSEVEEVDKKPKKEKPVKYTDIFVMKPSEK